MCPRMLYDRVARALYCSILHIRTFVCCQVVPTVGTTASFPGASFELVWEAAHGHVGTHDVLIRAISGRFEPIAPHSRRWS